jgi:transcriptional regulator with XRE-family HTH domain
MVTQIGLKIRNERKNMGLSLKELAAKIGISTMTLQRIETGKTSPSVSVLSQISSQLRQPMNFFIQEKRPKIVISRKEDQSTIESSAMSLRVIVPLAMTEKNILVNLGEGKPGRFIDPHVENGHSLVYVLEGKAVIEHDGVEHNLNAGDAVYYDARYRHTVKALKKKHKFLSVFFKE